MFVDNCHQRWHRLEGGTTVGMLRVMSKNGDDRLTWDSKEIQVGSSEALDPVAAVREAERITAVRKARLAFEKEVAMGATAYRIDAGKPTRIERFDVTAEQIVIVPRVFGG